MPSTVIVNMRTCSRKAEITASKCPDGRLKIDIETDCDNVASYASKIRYISETDVYDLRNSKIYSPDTLTILTPTCLVPIGVMDAASKELGLLTDTICKSAERDEIILDAKGLQ